MSLNTVSIVGTVRLNAFVSHCALHIMIIIESLCRYQVQIGIDNDIIEGSVYVYSWDRVQNGDSKHWICFHLWTKGTASGRLLQLLREYSSITDQLLSLSLFLPLSLPLLPTHTHTHTHTHTQTQKQRKMYSAYYCSIWMAATQPNHVENTIRGGSVIKLNLP